jgi:hypothetical protein
VNSLTLGSQTYTKTELLRILRTPIKWDARLIPVHQLIAAKLNIANGADGMPVTSTVHDGATLESYNNGNLTPSCGDK